MGLRVLVGNSRGWADEARVRAALEECYVAASGLVLPRSAPALTVVHGHDRNGADPVVDRWVWSMHRSTVLVARPERHPADWNGACQPGCQPGHRRDHAGGFTTCPAAGYYRDAQMVGYGADIALVFIHQGYRPAVKFAERCDAAGIPVVPFEE